MTREKNVFTFCDLCVYRENIQTQVLSVKGSHTSWADTWPQCGMLQSHITEPALGFPQSLPVGDPEFQLPGFDPAQSLAVAGVWREQTSAQKIAFAATGVLSCSRTDSIWICS